MTATTSLALKDGIQPAQAVRALAEAGAIAPATPFAADQVQPASLDLRLGRRAWRTFSLWKQLIGTFYLSKPHSESLCQSLVFRIESCANAYLKRCKIEAFRLR